MLKRWKYLFFRVADSCCYSTVVREVSVSQKKMTKIFRFEYNVDISFMRNQYRQKEKYIGLAVVRFDSNNLNSNKPMSALSQKKFKTRPSPPSIHLTALELDDANAKIHLLEHETTQFVHRCWYGVVPLCRRMWGNAEIGAHNSNHNEPNATPRR